MFTKRTIRFQSTLPREERQILILFNRFECLFQSTLPREERRNAKTSYSIRDNFNPRSHERSDNQAFHALSCFFRFQSTLPREERLEPAELTLIRYLFQSTLPREERQNSSAPTVTPVKFQSTLPREERHGKADRCTSGSNEISIHAPTRGAT